MKKFQPQFGAVYKALKYTEDNTFARFFPIWFMLKRYVFVTMVFNFDFTHGMIVFSLYLNLIDAIMVTCWLPYINKIDNRMEIFNLGFAYFFLLVL
jgi:hypothetical protein